MINLISNAVKFCDKTRGQIDISLTDKPDEICVIVRDNGIGISPENTQIIFEEFRQITDSSRGRPLGTGVGLTITRQIIEAHKGKVWVESDLGRGASFIFTLPTVQT